VSWVSGAIYPDGSGIPIPDQLSEDIFVGGTPTIPGYLMPLVSGTCGTPGCLDGAFDTALTFYKYMQTLFANLPANTKSHVENQGLYIECSDTKATQYVVNVDASTINSITWYTTYGCNLDAVWIINVNGGDVTFSGDYLPTIAEKTVWNIVGKGRTVTVVTEVRGNMLAPENTLKQTGGVIVGKVVFGNIAFSLQINLPKCFDLIIVRVNDFCAKSAKQGDLCVTLLSGGVFAIGDKIAFGTNPNVLYTIVSKTLNKDGTMTVCLDTPLQTSLIVNTRAFADINPNNLVAGRSDIATGSPASTVVASLALILAAMVALML